MARAKSRELLGQNICFLSDELPYGYYDEEHKIYLNKDSLGFVIKIDPLIMAEGKVSELLQLFEDILPVNCYVQFLLVASKNIEDILNLWAQDKLNSGNDILQKLAQKRVEHFTDNIFDRKYNFSVFISVSIAIKKPSLEDVFKLKALKENVEVIFPNAEDVNPQELIHTLTEFLNPGEKPAIEKFYPLETISRQLVSSATCLEVKADEMIFNEKYYSKAFILDKGSAKDWKIDMMRNLLGTLSTKDFSCPFLLQTAFQILSPDGHQEKEFFKADSSNNINFEMARKNPNIINQAREWNEFIVARSQGRTAVNTITQVFIISDKENIYKEALKIQSLYSGQLMKLSVDYGFQLANLLSMLPMSCATYGKSLKHFKKFKPTNSEEAAHTVPIVAEWKGTGYTGSPLCGRYGQIAFFNQYESQENYSCAISGNSGSGKSVKMLEIIMNQLAQGARVFVVDLGNSFFNFCQLYGGVYIDFDKEQDICLNPFARINPNKPKRVKASLLEIKKIIKVMIDPQENSLTNIENIWINQAVDQAWNKYGPKTTLDEIIAILKKDAHPAKNALGEMLYDYCEDSDYGKYFKGTPNIDFSSNLIVVDLAKLQEDKNFMAVIMQLYLLAFMEQLGQAKRERRTMLVIDEAWLMEDVKALATSTKHLVRTIRKLDGSLVLGTQSTDDYVNNPSSRVVYENSSWKIYFFQEAKPNLSGLNINLANDIRGLSKPNGKFSELIIQHAGSHVVQRFYLDPFSLSLYSTKPSDYRAILSYKNQGHDLATAVEMLSQTKIRTKA